MISSSKHIQVKQTTGQSKRFVISQKTVTDELSNRDLTIVQLQDAILELQERQTIFVDYWNVEPVAPTEEQVWLVIEGTTEGYIYINGEWLELPLSEKSVYVNRATNIQYAWNSSIMVEMTFQLTKPSIEALIYNDVLLLAGTNIDLSLNDVFDRSVTPLTGATTFTILNPIKYKPFRLILKGGSLNVPTFSTYTVNWINTSLVTDYVNTITNVLWCEIRATGQIYCFWGN